MTHKITRRQVIKLASGAILLPIACSHFPNPQLINLMFSHGVASGDPDQTSIVIWTRVSNSKIPVKVNWFISTDSAFKHMDSEGQYTTDDQRDYTVKVVVKDLKPGEMYFYKFEVEGVSSIVGQTRTLPVGHVKELTFAVATCSNFPFGYFNTYDAIANDPSIDLVIHLGDYIYEYGVDGYGGETGKRLGRSHEPSHEILNLDDYRQRHAQYKTDQGSLAMHARHPLIVIWDDHETANNPWMGGANNHQENEGSWEARRAASLQAYYEWMPIRDPANDDTGKKYWRHYKFGDLASLITLEGRHTGRSQQISYNEHLSSIDTTDKAQEFLHSVVGAQNRNMLSQEMEEFLKSELEESVQSNRRWRIIGNQTVIAKSSSPKLNTQFFDVLRKDLGTKGINMLDELTHLGKFDLPADLDTWDGYPVARQQFYQVAKNAGVHDLLVLSGDSHSYWANQLFDENKRSMGLELGATGITSPRSIMQLGEEAMKRYDELNVEHNQEIVWADGRHRGFIRLHIDHHGGHADFIAISNVDSRLYETKIIHSVSIINNGSMLNFD
ncbi:MAG: alkaline phosphatase D family protein [Alteromonadaceae bacterium]|nr:alkaline phosphatase D family protein [Alteromonadaceae bacterium]